MFIVSVTVLTIALASAHDDPLNLHHSDGTAVQAQTHGETVDPYHTHRGILDPDHNHDGVIYEPHTHGGKVGPYHTHGGTSNAHHVHPGAMVSTLKSGINAIYSSVAHLPYIEIGEFNQYNRGPVVNNQIIRAMLPTYNNFQQIIPINPRTMFVLYSSAAVNPIANTAQRHSTRHKRAASYKYGSPQKVKGRGQTRIPTPRRVDPFLNRSGRRVGAQFGSRLRNQFGNRFGNQLGGRLNNQFANRLGNPFGDRLGNPFGARLGNQFGARLGNQFGNQLGGMVDVRSRSQLGNPLGVRFGSQISNRFGNQFGGSGRRGNGMRFLNNGAPNAWISNRRRNGMAAQQQNRGRGARGW